MMGALSQLPNIGPKAEQQLEQADITTPERLKEFYINHKA